ncbi:hypothetical protein [Brevibacterium sp. SMBL_HHYL_HB1]|nr:hypothetical protein [Brevibacterium sp. SMBL_HHYL_HB1]
MVSTLAQTWADDYAAADETTFTDTGFNDVTFADLAVTDPTTR